VVVGGKVVVVSTIVIVVVGSSVVVVVSSLIVEVDTSVEVGLFVDGSGSNDISSGVVAAVVVS
jgi:hypothetical protein